MSDQKLTQTIAELWVDNGGDAEGFDWCYAKIKQAIQDEIYRRREHENEV